MVGLLEPQREIVNSFCELEPPSEQTYFIFSILALKVFVMIVKVVIRIAPC